MDECEEDWNEYNSIKVFVKVEQETQIHTQNEYPMIMLQRIMCNEQVEANISVLY